MSSSNRPLTDLLLELALDSNKLTEWLAASGSRSIPNIPLTLREAISTGDTEALRHELEVELNSEHRKSVQEGLAILSTRIASDLPPARRLGIFDQSFWSIMLPDPMWDFSGLTVVGTGIRTGLQTTPEALVHIKETKTVLYLVADPFGGEWVRRLNSNAESLEAFYRVGKRRVDIYNEIVEYVLSRVQTDDSVCVVFYGHPGIFVHAAHESVRLARERGFKARMLPGISAEANLCADLGIDPGVTGLQSYEATSFLLSRYSFDASSGLLLWQIGVFGYALWDPRYKPTPKHLQILVEYLTPHYGPDHKVVLYEASELPLGAPRIRSLRLCELAHSNPSPITTLYIPPRRLPQADLEVAKKLGFKYPIRINAERSL